MMRLSMALSFFAILLLPFAAGQTHPPADVLVTEQPSNQWFEAPTTQVAISGDAGWALFTRHSRVSRLVSLKTGRGDPARLNRDMDQVDAAGFCGPAGLVRLGERGSEKRWYLPDVESAKLSSLPLDAVFQCSPDGKALAYYHSDVPEEGLFLGTPGDFRNFQIPGRVIAMTFSPDSNALYVLLFPPSGKSSLARIRVNDLNTRVIASDLDASAVPDSLGVSPDGRSIFLALGSAGAPNNEARHQPDADRWLKIYQLDLATGARHPVAESAGQDNNDPTVAGGSLYWTRNVIHDSIVVVPASGGEAKEVVAGGEVPMWSPDSHRIAYTFGGWRLADWGLDLDDAVVSVDDQGQRASQPLVIIAGYHEDFPPAWSPDGKWIAYHSHRSRTAVPEYSSPASTDDIYLRRADDPHAPEIRLTDFGWETGPAYWSPDGEKLIFSSWERGGQPGIDKVWMITLDPETGSALHTDLLPLPGDIRSAQWEAWSPDGKEIAIEDNQGGEDRSIWVVHADGSHPEKLLKYEGTTYGGLDWSPDGKTIVYSGLAGDRLQLFAEPRAGGAPRLLSHDSGNLMHPRISPDGHWIASTRLVQSKQIWRRTLP
jgi:Tol biopolymer transport system component